MDQGSFTFTANGVSHLFWIGALATGLYTVKSIINDYLNYKREELVLKQNNPPNFRREYRGNQLQGNTYVPLCRNLNNLNNLNNLAANKPCELIYGPLMHNCCDKLSNNTGMIRGKYPKNSDKPDNIVEEARGNTVVNNKTATNEFVAEEVEYEHNGVKVLDNYEP